MRAFFGLALTLLAMASGLADAAAIAEVQRIEGKGEYREARQSAWSSAKEKQPLNDGDFVRTLDLSKMAIVFTPQREVMQIPANSQMQVTGTADKKTIDLQKGRGWFKSQGNPRGMDVKMPGGTAAIRGTEWEVEVDDEGRGTISVFAGEVDVFNDLGRVTVGPNEQAIAERGKAPVKLTLRTSRERIQWVSSSSIDANRHGDPGVAGVAQAISEQRLADAYAALKRAGDGAPANAHLLLADFEVYQGDLAQAEAVLRRAASRYPGDERIDVALARVALFSDRPAEALARAKAAVAKRRSADALVVLGDVERHQGRAREAMNAYNEAAKVAAKDARPWLGLGIIQSERENVRRARSDLGRAIALDPKEADAYAELGNVEGLAGNPARGREALLKALELQPQNYVALTALGVNELRDGNVDAAIDALMRATALEPRYARAHLYLAAARYQAGHDGAAFEELKRAAELDPNDPLPHMLTSIILLDRIEPGRAAVEAQEALARLPYLKSLNAVVNDQKGAANFGYPLSFMGLEAWARSAAHDSYLPFWGGSHLFLADRYPGEFSQRSELMQGFITDPLVFGASNRRQSLFISPGRHFTATAAADWSDDLRVYEPTFTANGMVTGAIPFAYFAEVSEATVEPGNVDFDARFRTATAALGARLGPELGAFLYASHVDARFTIGIPASRAFQEVEGDALRVDAGLRYALSRRSSLWFKAGRTESDTVADFSDTLSAPGIQPLEQRLRFLPGRRQNDAALRYTTQPRDGLELTAGAEMARVRQPIALDQDAVFHFVGTTAPQNRLRETDRDRADSVYVLGNAAFGRFTVEAGATWRNYRKQRDIATTFEARPSANAAFTEIYERKKTDPALGIVWRPFDHAALRAMCRRWVRTIAPDTMMPIDIAGIPVDDQLVFAGGTQEQCRAQADWRLAPRTFVSASYERIETENLVSTFGEILNQQSDLTNLDRLRARLFTPPIKPDLLEATPAYAGGIVKRGRIALEQLVTPRIGARVHYTYTHSENTFYPFDLRIPYLPRHEANIAVAWTPGWRSRVLAQVVYRSRRFADEGNSLELPAGWDGLVSLYFEDPGKRWSVELKAANLLKKESSDRFGIVLSYRF